MFNLCPSFSLCYVFSAMSESVNYYSNVMNAAYFWLGVLFYVVYFVLVMFGVFCLERIFHV